MTLFKTVLESILYWLSLSKIAKSSIRKIRRSMFDFLWIGKNQRARLYLANRELLS